MAFNMNKRHQTIMFPNIIEDYVPADAPVRVYDAFVDALDFGKLGIDLNPNPRGGADEYYPKDMLKLLVYGVSYGIRSSRKLERACYDNLSFIWLMGGLKPDYRTIARFRGTYKDAIKKVLKECVRLCIKMNLIEGNVLFVDGSKFRADASINKTWTKKRCEKHIRKIEERIDQIMDNFEKTDAREKQEESLVKIKEEIHDKARLINQIKDIMADLEDRKQASVNLTDEDSVIGKSRQGMHAIHNVQSVVDGKHGLIVHAEAVSQSNDHNQLSVQVENAVETTGISPGHVCADAGYAGTADLKKIDAEINVIVPSQRQVQEKKGLCPIKPFAKQYFDYDRSADEYVCPKGKRLKFQDIPETGKRRYKADGHECQACPHFGNPKDGRCTQSVNGRRIIRLVDEDFKKRLEAVYELPENQAIYKWRKETVEHPFGHMKRNLGAGQFLLRGTSKVNAEVSLLGTCFNIARMITILGIPALLGKLTGS